MAHASPGATLRDEQQLVGSMVELMKKEQQFLVGADVDSLEMLTPTKLQLVQRTALLSRTRHKALGAAGFPAAESGMAPWLDARGNDALRGDWQRLLELTREAKELNRVNGMLINKQLAQTHTVLAELRGPVANPGGVYGRSGQATLGGPSKRFVVG
jgi:flagella synthesis protein FlgN